MQLSGLRRWAAFAGLAFVPLLVASIVMTFGAPMPDKSTAKIVKWYSDNREIAFASGALSVAATFTFLWFLGYLHRTLAAMEGAAGGLSSIVALSGVYTVTVATITSIPTVLLGVLANRPGTPNDSLVHTLGDFGTVSISLIGVGLAVFLGSLGLALASGAISPRWAVWVAYIGSILTLVGGLSGFFVNKGGKPNPISFLGLIGTVFFLVVVLAISIGFLRTPSEVDAGAR